MSDSEDDAEDERRRAKTRYIGFAGAPIPWSFAVKASAAREDKTLVSVLPNGTEFPGLLSELERWEIQHLGHKLKREELTRFLIIALDEIGKLRHRVGVLEERKNKEDQMAKSFLREMGKGK